MPKTRLWFTDDNPPPVKISDVSPHKVKVYSWEWSDKRRSYQPVVTGERDPDAEIQAAKGETLKEIMARMPGNTPLEKLTSAVNKGIVIPPEMEPGKVVDHTIIPNNYLDAFNAMQEGAAAYKKIPEEYRKKYEDPMEAYQAYVNDLIKADEAKKADKAQEGAKEDGQK